LKRVRHLFPGNNTPKGFFSFYKFILGQREANRIMCIKGGPGVGKSSFMMKIADEFIESGEEVDLMHCSSDPDSLDAVVLKNRKIAFIDATSPHIVDPVTPGAVDNIIHLGEYWDEEGIRRNKKEVIECNENIRAWFGRGYNYLAAAEKTYDLLADIYSSAVKPAEIYRIAATIVVKELQHYEISLRPGNVKKYFASAITPKGFVNNLKDLAVNCNRIYLISVPFGLSADRILRVVSEGAVYRGFGVEEYYCPIKPDIMLEHLVIPELRTAFITVNEYHDVEPWQFGEEGDDYPEIRHIDLSDLVDETVIEKERRLILESREFTDALMKKAIDCIAQAKKEHDVLEEYYIPNMDFKKIDALRHEIVAKIRAEDV